jgi:hypothetical protein
MTKANRSIDQDWGTKVAFNSSMSLSSTIVGANKRDAGTEMLAFPG